MGSSVNPSSARRWHKRIKGISRISESDLESLPHAATKGLGLTANFIWSGCDTLTHTHTDDCSVSQLPVSLASSATQPCATFSASSLRAHSLLDFLYIFSEFKKNQHFSKVIQNFCSRSLAFVIVPVLLLFFFFLLAFCDGEPHV